MEPQGKDRIIVALDVDELWKAEQLVEALAPHVRVFKVGLELLTAAGSKRVVTAIHGYGTRIMYDGKFNDIPNTMAGATRAVAAHGVEMFTVHASCGLEGMRAVAAAKGVAKALAVTVLTSFDDAGSETVFGGNARLKVAQFAMEAKLAGLDGIVCSPKELEFLGSHGDFDGLLKVTPGVRPSWAATADQKRVMTPYEAILAGADYLVIGRPITNPPAEVGSCVDAAKRIAEEIDSALERRAILKACIAAEGKGGCGC